MRILLGTLLVLVMGAGLLGCESEDSVFDEPERFWGLVLESAGIGDLVLGDLVLESAGIELREGSTERP